MSRNVRKRRDKLWVEKDAKCYWCGITTVLPKRGDGKALPTPDLATLDHLRTRLDPERQIPNNCNEERTCLACWHCNNVRGRLTQLCSQDITIKIKNWTIKNV